MEENVMFLENKYKLWYDRICNKTYTGILETHHYIPKSLGGNDNESNLRMISPKAHFICHWLLTKMISDVNNRRKMYYAFNFMLRKPKDLKDKRYYPCSRVYEISRNLLRGDNNPSKSVDVRKKISEKRKEQWKNPSKAMLDGIEKMRISKKGKIAHNKGVIGVYKMSADTKRRFSQMRTGRKWYNDGTKTYFIHPSNKKDNYVLGRI